MRRVNADPYRSRTPRILVGEKATGDLVQWYVYTTPESSPKRSTIPVAADRDVGLIDILNAVNRTGTKAYSAVAANYEIMLREIRKLERATKTKGNPRGGAATRKPSRTYRIQGFDGHFKGVGILTPCVRVVNRRANRGSPSCAWSREEYRRLLQKGLGRR